MGYLRKLVAFICLACFLSTTLLFSTILHVSACSRVLYADNGQAVLVGRNMDWPSNPDVALWVMPHGIQREGIPDNNPLVWTAQYGSIVTASYESGNGCVTDGINEKGLAANLLWLTESNYGERDERLPGLSVAMWAQYILDNCATVQEAVTVMQSSQFQVVKQIIPRTTPAGTVMKPASLHLSLADKTGDSAIIEYIDGKQVIYHDRNYTIMTNSPTFEKQQENLKQYQGFGGDKPLPGTSDAADRFVRAAYYMKYLPKPHNIREAIAGVFSVTRNASQPFRLSADLDNPYTSSTIWRTVADLTNGYYYFESTYSPAIIWVSFSQFNLNEGLPAMKLDVAGNPDYSGNVSERFAKGNPSELKVPKL